MIRCADLATVLQAASTGLLTPVTLSLRFRRSVLALDQRKLSAELALIYRVIEKDGRDLKLL